jgi:hypothetical protein
MTATVDCSLGLVGISLDDQDNTELLGSLTRLKWELHISFLVFFQKNSKKAFTPPNETTSSFLHCPY